MDLKLLLASLDDAPSDRAAYLKGGVTLTQVQSEPRPAAVDPGAPPPPPRLEALGSPYDLPRQRWAVIVPEQGGEELLRRIAPLVALREKEQQAPMFGDAAGKPFSVPPQLTFEQAARWIQTRLNPLPRAQRPRYLLILGSPDQVSIELQQALSVHYYVGRLAFDDPEGYNAYAAKVVDFARPESWRATARALSYTVRTEGGLDAPDDGYEKLMLPVIEGSKNPFERLPLAFINASPLPGQASAQHLLQLARDPSPTVLMSMSHGLGRSKSRPWSEAELRRFQGMMFFGSKREPLRAEDVASGDFLPGGLWFYFACFGAGTPARSAYRHWLQSISPNLDVLKALPENGSAFIAALPQAALANRRGPLAVIGHLDLAWSYSYDQRLTKRSGQAQRFVQLLRLAERDDERRRIGPIFHTLLEELPQVQHDLANQYDFEAQAGSKPPDPRARASLWMLRQDLYAYILLGDPAAYLPMTPRPQAAPLSQFDLLGVAPVLQPESPVEKSGVPLDGLVAAVLACLGEKKPPELVARELGISVTELQRWVDIYKNAGREALSQKLGK